MEVKTYTRKDIDIVKKQDFTKPIYYAMIRGSSDCIAQADSKEELQPKITSWIAHRQHVATFPHQYVRVNTLCNTGFYARKKDLGMLHPSKYIIHGDRERWFIASGNIPNNDEVTIDGLQFETEAEAVAFIDGWNLGINN